MAAFREMVVLAGTDGRDEDVLGDGVAFAGVAKYPARVKCALLGWTAFKAVLAQRAPTDARRREGERMTETAATARPATRLEEAMRDVVDPELGINVVDLGLVYGMSIEQGEPAKVARHRHDADLGGLPADRRHRGPGPHRADRRPDAAGHRIKINWVWMPPWGPDKITDDGREQLRALGFNV